MRSILVFVLMTIIGILLDAGDCRAEDDRKAEKTWVSPDSIFSLVKSVPLKVYDRVRLPGARRLGYTGIIISCPFIRYRETYDYYSREGTFYSIEKGGRRYPVFEFEHFRIDEESRRALASVMDDPMDELLGYSGKFIFEDFDFRRHLADSLKLGRAVKPSTMKK